VNMTSDELEAWLKDEQSSSSGWSKSDGSGETIGHERFARNTSLSLPLSPSSHIHLTHPSSHSDYSGRKIIQILQKNPRKDPSKYDEDDITHMRRVAAYCKRHLAQEEKAKRDTDSKSYKSLKNWGHDALKA
jgi:Protein of unknown function (DUF3140)